MEWVIGYWQISVHRVWPTNERLTQMYNTAASCWHAHLQLLGYKRVYARLFQSLQQSGVLAHLKDDSLACDCGIGTAAFSLALAQTVPAQLDITGVDISLEMLGKVHQLLNRAGVNHQLCQSNVSTLPYSDNTFDLVMSTHMLEHLPAPSTGLREMVRVLRPGAPLILAVTRRGLLGSLIQLRWGNGCLQPKVLLEMMIDTGLTNIHFYPFTFGLSHWTSIACVGLKNEWH
jgi:demethylmenaquinone methyltransferase/2-methoxy-6-polyprenyl-1,4-benzoquinol methylase